MGAFTLTRTSIRAGIYEGLLTSRAKRKTPPTLVLWLLDSASGEVSVVAEPDMANCWSVRAVIDPALIGEGVQTFLIRDPKNDETLDSFVVIAGGPLQEDLSAEIALLRSELEMLKRAFRQHCIDGHA